MLDSQYPGASTSAEARAHWQQAVGNRQRYPAVEAEVRYHFPKIDALYCSFRNLVRRDQDAYDKANPAPSDVMALLDSAPEPFGPQHWAEDTLTAHAAYEKALANLTTVPKRP